MRSTTLFTVSALGFTAFIEAVPSPRLQKRTHWDSDVAPWWPACPAGQFPGWEYHACYKDPLGTALAWNTLQTPGEITWNSCIDACKGSNFRYAGIMGAHGAKQCLCGSTISASPCGSEASCNAPCNDGGNQCGGQGFISIWRDKTFLDIPAATAATGYTYYGCFKDDSLMEGTRELRRILQGYGGNVRSVQECLNSCAAQNFPFAGIENGNQCFCGGKLRTDLVAKGKDESWCTAPCAAESKLRRRTHFCGGQWAISIYYNDQLASNCQCGCGPNCQPRQPPASSTSTCTTSSTTSSPPPPPPPSTPPSTPISTDTPEPSTSTSTTAPPETPEPSPSSSSEAPEPSSSTSTSPSAPTPEPPTSTSSPAGYSSEEPVPTPTPTPAPTNGGYGYGY
ncbi:hypothetical protein TWF694_008797 [Orbilia ellipsospora]|uniref:WSC domain-containing protein n=1 Tax=Orbilia ellipsospora TaxID=2528407 RepID=A0AAV9XCZ3_9PEZI